MIYDKTPHPYAHFEHLPFAKEPLKAIYVFQRLLTTLCLVPFWAVYYGALPPRFRPRESWSVKQIIYVNFTRRIYKVTEVAGVTFNTRDPELEPSASSLKETRFEWAPVLPDDLREGAVGGDYGRVPFKRVGMFVWPRHTPAFRDRVPIIGLFMHGGGYCHMSAHENSRTSNIPRRLMKGDHFSEIYSIEYRLLQLAPFPAAVVDAATAYTYVSRARPDTKIVLIGDSSGGNLVLALTRWIRDHGKLPMPAGLLLLSPSCDASHAFPEVASEYFARPNAETDYLTDTPEPRALLQRTFLGFKYRPKNVGWNPLRREGEDQMESHLRLSSLFKRTRKVGSKTCTDNEQVKAEIEEEDRRLDEILHSEYVSPASPKVLRRWGHEVDLYNGQTDGSASAMERIGFPPKILVGELAPSMLPDNVAGWPGLFAAYPKCMVVIGDAERLTTEVGNLTRAMCRDGVDIRTRWVKDAVHDVLMIPPGWWDEEIRKDVWKDIDEWMDTL